MSNTGLYPADPTTQTGQFRLVSGDWNGTPTDPPDDPQTATYLYWGDDEIAAFLAISNGSVNRAIGHGIMQLARNAAMLGQSVKTDDLALNDSQRGKDLSTIAQDYFTLADKEDGQANASFFAIAAPPHKHYAPHPLFPWILTW